MVNKISPELYKRVSLNDLALFCVSSDKDFEKIVKQCFEVFPKAFCFPKIKKWPDSRKIEKSLRRLERKKLIKGDVKSGFSLTLSGRKRIEEIAKVFRQERLI